MSLDRSVRATPWQVVRLAGQKLSSTGDVSFEPIGLAPLSSVATADLVYTPHTGPNEGIMHVIEFTSSGSTALPSVAVANSIRRMRHLEETKGVRFVLATSGQIRTDLLDVDLPPGMQLLGEISTGDDLAKKLNELMEKGDE